MPLPSTLPIASRNWALFLDVDGTLLELAPTPDAVSVEAGLLQILQKLAERLGHALALISGRRIATLDELFAPLRLPAAGLHGLEWRALADSCTIKPTQHEGLEHVRRSFRAFAAAHQGALLEDKGLTLALHYRQAPQLEARVQELARALLVQTRELDALGPGLRTQQGFKVLEVLPEGADKGAAIHRFMQFPPFTGRLPVFLGDDLTDEPGFLAVNAMGGHSIRIGAAECTHARLQIEGVAQTLEWLDEVGRGLASSAS